MGKARGPYREEFPVGSLVKIVNHAVLEDFVRTWDLHNKLQAEQLDYAGKAGTIKSVGFYHCDDELCEIEGCARDVARTMPGSVGQERIS